MPVNRAIIAAALGAFGGFLFLLMRAKKKRSDRRQVVSEPSDVTHASEWVEAASEDSFPASDPPAWTGTGL